MPLYISHWSLKDQETDKLRNKNNEVLVIDVLRLQDIVFENILSTEQLTFQLLTLISFNWDVITILIKYVK